MRSVIGSLFICIAFGLYPSTLRADVLVVSSLSLTSLQILPGSGTVQFLSPFGAAAFVQVSDSLGGFDQQFNEVEDGATSASAATTLAYAAAAASALDMTASASSGINIPQIEAAAGTDPGSPYGLLQGLFQIVGATGPVTVQLKATLDANQSLSTTGYGQSAASELTYSLLLPDISDAPVLFFDNLLQIGPNDSEASSSSFTLSASVTLQPDTSYYLLTEPDAETRGISHVPEPSSVWLLLTGLVLGASLIAREKWARRKRA